MGPEGGRARIRQVHGYFLPPINSICKSLPITDSALKLLKPPPSPERVIHLIPLNDFLKMLVHQLPSDSVQVTNCAHSILIQIARYCKAEENVPWMNVCKIILVEIVLLWSNIKEATSDKAYTTIRVQYANTVIALACVGKYNDEEVEQIIVSTLNSLLVDGVFNDNQDVLLQISIFDLISNNIVSLSGTPKSRLIIDWLSNTFSKQFILHLLQEDKYMMKSDALRLYSYIAVLWKRQNYGTNSYSDFESIIFNKVPQGPIHIFF